MRTGKLAVICPLVLVSLLGMPDRSSGAVVEVGRLKVLGLSLLLPGLGHWQLGARDKAYAFMGADASLWTGYSVFRVQAELRKDSYIEIAELFAGVGDASGRSDTYYRRLGAFRSSDVYEEEIRREARQIYPDDLQARESYFQSHRVPPEQRWSWRSNADWNRYREKRNDSNRSLKKADYMIGVALANRLLAAVDAIRLSNGYSSGRKMGMYFTTDPVDPDGGARFVLTYRFP